MIKRLVLIIGFLILGLLLQGIGLAETENYCDDPDSWKEWEELIQKHPTDMEDRYGSSSSPCPLERER
jgi:hypothetical protein